MSTIDPRQVNVDQMRANNARFQTAVKALVGDRPDTEAMRATYAGAKGALPVMFLDGERIWGFTKSGQPIFDRDLTYFYPKPTQLAMSVNWATQLIGYQKAERDAAQARIDARVKGVWNKIGAQEVHPAHGVLA